MGPPVLRGGKRPSPQCPEEGFQSCYISRSPAGHSSRSLSRSLSLSIALYRSLSLTISPLALSLSLTISPLSLLLGDDSSGQLLIPNGPKIRIQCHAQQMFSVMYFNMLRLCRTPMQYPCTCPCSLPRSIPKANYSFNYVNHFDQPFTSQLCEENCRLRK